MRNHITIPHFFAKLHAIILGRLAYLTNTRRHVRKTLYIKMINFLASNFSGLHSLIVADGLRGKFLLTDGISRRFVYLNKLRNGCVQFVSMEKRWNVVNVSESI